MLLGCLEVVVLFWGLGVGCGFRSDKIPLFVRNDNLACGLIPLFVEVMARRSSPLLGNPNPWPFPLWTRGKGIAFV